MGTIGSELDFFRSAVARLSASVGSASSLWRDEKFAELSASVREIASQSSDLMSAGERCSAAVNRFQAIAGERY